MTTVSREREATASQYEVQVLRDPAQIRALLETERAYSAYPLAQLDPRLYDNNDWILSRGPAGREALLVHSRTGLGNALFATGDPVALDAALSLHPGARFSFGSLRPEHRRVVDKYYLMTRPQMMMRMSVHPRIFQATDGPAVRLTGADVSMINRLYSMEGGPTAYREAHMLDGVYYGVFVGHRLAAVAGTHVVSEREGVAVVGNVFTHPRHRGQGLATCATSAVTRHLLEFCNLVVLTVEVGNEPAVHVYNKLGYQPVCKLHESPLIRKEPFGAISFLRRSLAAWRGRAHGKEIVLK
jgi:RimJ/RimL family protein N-acetyltransferase